MIIDLRQQLELDLGKEKLALGLRGNESHLGYGEFCVTKVRGGVEVEV